MATMTQACIRYEDDLFAWTQEQAALLRAHAVDAIDWENLAEEIESHGRPRPTRAEEPTTVILPHLLKWQAQPALRGASWRRRCARSDGRSGSAAAKPEPAARGARHGREAYADAVKDAIDETGLRATRFRAPAHMARRRPGRGTSAGDGPVAADGRRAGSGALAGITVIDLTRVLGGPYATQILGDHGAEVIKLEPPQGDEVRDWGPPFQPVTTRPTLSASTATSARWGSTCAGRRPRVLLRLLERADADRELQARLAWRVGHRLRGVLAALSEADLLPDQWLRCGGAARWLSRLRCGDPGDAGIRRSTACRRRSGHGGPTRIGIPLVDLCTGLYAAIAHADGAARARTAPAMASSST